MIKEDVVRSWLTEGNKKNASYMLVVCVSDSDSELGGYKPVYVFVDGKESLSKRLSCEGKSESLKRKQEEYSFKNSGGRYKTLGTFDFDKSLDDQIASSRFVTKSQYVKNKGKSHADFGGLVQDHS